MYIELTHEEYMDMVSQFKKLEEKHFYTNLFPPCDNKNDLHSIRTDGPYIWVDGKQYRQMDNSFGSFLMKNYTWPWYRIYDVK